MQHILIDYESIQPTSFKQLDVKDCHVWLFLGVQQQKNLPLQLVESLLEFQTKNIHIIKMPYGGKNALDLYLAYHLGHILALDPQAKIQVLARDGGYDRLIKHLNQSEIVSNVIRVVDTVAQLQIQQQPKQSDKKQQAQQSQKKQLSQKLQEKQADKKQQDKNSVDKVQRKQLKKQRKKRYKKSYKRALALLEKQIANSRPKNKQSLTNYLQDKLPDADAAMIEKIIKKLVKKQHVYMEQNNKIDYRF
ncbi:PIN domain-containing protein [Psychrobacter lutiphocae]|uniref:PIN domain-containing protein n=1 Tax=Psychrobacter lutiphocae TaxID=540500 RepID=UPI00037542B3|nr:PIN domain-containing protein [Psychrobacter lutiphocae]